MHDACIIQTKRCVYFLEFFNYNVLKMGVFMVKPALSGHPQKMGFHRMLKMMKNAILCHNWSLYVQKLLKSTTNINFGREKGVKFC